MSSNEPKVSVIIPAYNAAGYIRQAVCSVIDQTYPEPIEILVVDDCSKDTTTQAVKDIAKDAAEGVCLRENRYLHYFRNEENKGVAFTRNAGVGKARGEYVAFLDSDDWWDPEKLEKQMQVMEQNGEDICLCFTGRELMDADGNSLQKRVPVPERVSFRDMLKTNYVTCSSVILKREIAAAYPMTDDKYCEDYICWMRILKDGGAAAGINEPLVKYRMVKGSKSNNKWKAASNHYHSLRILGIGTVRAFFCMISYAYHGVRKYS
ncbi:MAG: glycosyltransferase family 2 protein [Lachnospiraceae bacterium]|nr:glycosyltransferase family 2 protein [Lachnospiraceae bacterium]